MKKKLTLSTRKLIGFYILLFGLIILFKIIFLKEFKIIYIILVIIFIISLDFIVRSIIKKRKDLLLVPGIFFLLSDIFLLAYFILKETIHYDIIYLWPIIGIFAGISLVVYYFRSKEKNAAIIVPGFFFIFLGSILILFTSNILNFGFKYFLIFLLPGLIILLGVYLIFAKEIKYLKRYFKKNNKK